MLADFRTDLTQKVLIKEKSVPFYLKWMADGYAFLDCPRSEPLGHSGKEQFLQHLCHDPRGIFWSEKPIGYVSPKAPASRKKS